MKTEEELRELLDPEKIVVWAQGKDGRPVNDRRQSCCPLRAYLIDNGVNNNELCVGRRAATIVDFSGIPEVEVAQPWHDEFTFWADHYNWEEITGDQVVGWFREHELVGAPIEGG